MTINELKAELKNLGIDFAAKAKKAELEALLAAASPTEEPVEAEKPARKRTSTKEILRGLFTDVGDALLVEDVVAHVTAEAKVKEATIGTMIGDLKNPKYCGAAGPIYIERKGDEYVRVEAPAS